MEHPNLSKELLDDTLLDKTNLLSIYKKKRISNVNTGQSKKKKKFKRRSNNCRKITEFYKSSQTVSNTCREEVHIYCKARCEKCSIDTLPEQRKVKCQICSFSLVYYCAMCQKRFLNLGSIRNHVITELEKISTSSKCSKCHRSHFSTSCSLIKHESNCNTIYSFDKEIIIKIQQLDFQSKILRDVKPLTPLQPSPATNNPGVNFSETGSLYIHDSLEIGPEFKPPTMLIRSSRPQPKYSSSKFKLTYCTQCRQSQECIINREVFDCQKCGTVLTFKCGKCLKIFQTRNSLENHVRVCNKNLEASCLYCDFKTYDRKILSIHERTNHKLKGTDLQKCYRCAKILKSKSRDQLRKHLNICSLPPHLKRFENRTIFFCDICDYKINNKNRLSLHIQAKHLPRDPNLNKCRKCGKNFSQRYGLKKHAKTCGKSRDIVRMSMRFTCDYCQHKSGNKSHLLIHIKAKHLRQDLELSTCGRCGKGYKTPEKLNEHSKICGLPVPKRHSCDHCDFKSNTKSAIRSHIQAKHLPKELRPSYVCCKCKKKFTNGCNLRTHSKLCGLPSHLKRSLYSKGFICDYCKYQTPYKHLLVHHIQGKHLPKDPNLNRCNKCGKNLSSQSSLSTHFKICGLNYRFCDNCDFKSKTKEILAAHIKTEHMVKEIFNCTKCGKNFVSKLILSRHSNICGLPKQKDFFCDYCGLKCTFKYNLIKHIKVKHLPRDYNSNRCNNCGKSFGLKMYLNRHSKFCGLTEDSKNLLKRFQCDHCDYKCLEKTNLLGHIQRQHLPLDSNAMNCCHHCGFKCYSKGYLRKHIQSKHLLKGPLLPRFYCDHCNFKSYHKSSLYIHIHRKHFKLCGFTKSFRNTYNKIFNCDYCGYRTPYKHLLVQHIQGKHLPKDPNLNRCNRCGKNLSSRSSLSTHLKTCGLRDHYCNRCDFKCKRKRMLFSHIQSKHMKKRKL